MNIINAKNKTIDITEHPVRIALVVSRFNENITGALLDGAITHLQDFNITDDAITVVHVPGAVEIPIAAKRLAKSGQFDAIITLGAVIKGETAHFEYVSEQVNQGCQRVVHDYDIPVIFGVITAYTQEQAQARSNGDHGHLGIEAVDSALEMISVLKQIDKS